MKGGLKKNCVEALAGYRGKQVPVPAVRCDKSSRSELRVEFRATHRRAVDVDRDHATRVPRREHRAHAGAGTEIQRISAGAQLPISNHEKRGEKKNAPVLNRRGLNTVGSTSSGVPCTCSRRTLW